MEAGKIFQITSEATVTYLSRDLNGNRMPGKKKKAFKKQGPLLIGGTIKNLNP